MVAYLVMKYCPKCGNKYSDDTNYCLVDGHALPKNDPNAQTLKLEADKTPHDVPEVIFTSESATLALGDYFDFKLPKHTLRIKLEDFKEDRFPEILVNALSEKQPVARLSIISDGLIHGGRCTHFIEHNQYWVPVTKGEHFESHCLYFFKVSNDITVLFRLWVEHINLHSKTAELKLAYFRYIKSPA